MFKLQNIKKYIPGGFCCIGKFGEVSYTTKKQPPAVFTRSCLYFVYLIRIP